MKYLHLPVLAGGLLPRPRLVKRIRLKTRVRGWRREVEVTNFISKPIGSPAISCFRVKL